MKKNTKPISQFVICINTDDSDLLTPRMIYQTLPDDSAIRSNHIRVIDNEGEDYLYPADYFVPMAFPQTIERTLLRISRQFTPNVSVAQKRRNVSTLKRKTKPSAA
jgi:hypothetical protein